MQSKINKQQEISRRASKKLSCIESNLEESKQILENHLDHLYTAVENVKKFFFNNKNKKGFH